MKDNLFAGSLFALIVAVATAAACAMVGVEMEYERLREQAPRPAAQRPVAVAELPRVTVIGQRRPGDPVPARTVALAASANVHRLH